MYLLLFQRLANYVVLQSVFDEFDIPRSLYPFLFVLRYAFLASNLDKSLMDMLSHAYCGSILCVAESCANANMTGNWRIAMSNACSRVAQ